MERLARFVVHHRKLVLFVAVLLLIPSLLGAIGTYINYDILTYLPAELDSMIGETYLEDDFHMASTAMLTVENLPTAETLKMKDELAQVPGVRKVVWTSDMLDVTIPSEMLPADVRDFFYNNSGATMLLVQFEGTSASAETMAAIQQIKTILRKDCFIGGMSAILADTKALIDQEIPLYVLCAVGCSLVVLFLSLKSTVVPFIFMLGLAFPIAYNFGTNIFLGQISYITEALATVLQLGVTMDFSIFLLHRFEEEKADLGGTNLTDAQLEECMTRAICNTASSISASSLTTIAGFLAMCTMSLTLGADIGIVMAKGVALGVVCTVTVLPALLMQFRKPIEKFNHRTLIPKLPRTAKFVTKHYLPLLICFLILVVPFAIAQNKVDIYYTLFDSLPQTMDGIVGTNRLKDDFNMTTSHFVPEAKRIRFFMTFGQSYLDHMRCLEDVGMLSTTPVSFNGQEIVPIQFLKALLPDPASLGPRTKGKTNIGCIFTGKKDGKEKTYYIYNVCDHQECYKEVGSQAISYTTGVPAMCGALMLLTGKWTTKGVHTVEEFDPDPYLDALDKYGLPRSESHSPALVD